MDRKIKILISGWYGSGNIGDEAVLLGMLTTIQKYIPDCQLTVLSNRPSFNQRVHKIICIKQLPIGFKDFLIAILQRTLIPTIKAFKKNTVFIMGGGGFLSDWHRRVPWGWLKQMLLAKLYKSKTMLYGIGAGPFHTRKGKRIIRFIINNFVDIVTVRDITSSKALMAAGVHQDKIVISGDPAVAIKPPVANIITWKMNPAKKNIGLVITPYLQRRNPARFESLNNALLSILRHIEKDAEIIFIPFQQDDDYNYCSVLQKKLNNSSTIIDTELHPSQVISLIMELDLIISFRFHGNVLAAYCGKPFIPIIYHHKTADFLNELQYDYSLEFGEEFNWPIQDIDLDKFKDYYQKLLLNPIKIKNDLLLRMELYKKNEKKNIQLLLKLLKE